MSKDKNIAVNRYNIEANNFRPKSEAFTLNKKDLRFQCPCLELFSISKCLSPRRTSFDRIQNLKRNPLSDIIENTG